MSNTIFVAFCLMVILEMFLFVSFKITKSKLDKARLDNAFLSRNIKRLETENSKLREEMKIKSKNEREANEKIDSLHAGDSVANAIGGLCKPAGSDS